MSSAKYNSYIQITSAKKCMKNHRLVATLGVPDMIVSCWSIKKNATIRGVAYQYHQDIECNFRVFGRTT